MLWTEILALLKQFLPKIVEWIEKWLEGQFTRSTKKLPRPEGDKAADLEKALRQVLADTPRRFRLRRAFVASLIERIPPAVRAGKKKLAKADAEEVQAWATDVDDVEGE